MFSNNMEISLSSLIKELLYGVAPLGAGVYLFTLGTSLAIFISVLLISFGCVLMGILVSNFLKREKA